MSDSDRRDPFRQHAVIAGRRATDPALSTRACADRLGVGTDFIIGEIRDGRLVATVIERPGMRAVYRVAAIELHAYILRFGWKHSAPLKARTAPTDTPGRTAGTARTRRALNSLTRNDFG